MGGSIVDRITLYERIVYFSLEFAWCGGLAGGDWGATVILCLDAGVGCLTEVGVVCWAEPFTFLVARTSCRVCTMGVHLVCVSCEDGVAGTVSGVRWFSKSETLVSDTTTDSVCRSADGDDGSSSTIDGSSECEGIYGTTGVDRGDAGWTGGTASS